MRQFAFLLGLASILLGCAEQPTPAPLAVDVLDAEGQTQLCAVVEAEWDQDWTQVIYALDALARHGVNCTPDQPSDGKLYAAYFNYGAAFERLGELDNAITQYQAAVGIRPDGREALAALERLGVPTPTPPPLERCAPQIVAQATLPPYQASQGQHFISVEEGGFAAGGVKFLPRGINYFPMRYPWRRFLTEADIETIHAELNLIRETGFNTLRIFLWHDGLFQCPGNGAVPVQEAFRQLDAVIQESAALGFRLIVALNDLPDLTVFPLYTNPDYTQQQTAFIVERYREEAAIMAWDVRNEGDIDARQYESISPEMVLTWLNETVTLIRRIDSQHLITAGWLRDELTTEPYVDFISFHYWNAPDNLQGRIEATLASTEKPVLMEEFGYSTFNVPPETQRDFLIKTIKLSEAMGVDGWLIWTAFDFPLDATCVPPACPSIDNAEHHFGIWTGEDYTPKPAVEVLQNFLLNR